MRKSFCKLIVSIALVMTVIITTVLTASAASVTPTLSYDGKHFKFVTTANDIFLNFDRIVPGSTSEQQMKLVNTSSKETEYFVRVDYDDGFKVSKEDKKLAKKLVEELLIIRIEDEKGTELYKGPVGAEDEIKLSKLNANEEKLLKVSVIADPSIGNEYQNFSVEVNWSFIIRQPDDEPIIIEDLTPLGPSVDGPLVFIGDETPQGFLANTADLANPLLWIGIFVVAAIGVTIFVVIKKKKGSSPNTNIG